MTGGEGRKGQVSPRLPWVLHEQSEEEEREHGGGGGEGARRRRELEEQQGREGRGGRNEGRGAETATSRITSHRSYRTISFINTSVNTLNKTLVK